MKFGNRIVTDGLVFAVDAANPISYPGSGTAWNDLTPNKNNGTLINGPTFDSANAGSIVFDGVNDYTSVPNSPDLIFGNGVNDFPFTFSAWIKLDTSNGSKTIMRNFLIGDGCILWMSGGLLSLYWQDGNAYSWLRMYNNLDLGEWVNVVGTYNGSNGANGGKIYINGILQSAQILGGGTYIAMDSNTIDPFIISQVDRSLDGNMSNAHIYNKELSSTEVLQNYNALKDRFGL
jgi:hypothetical protein